MNKDEKFQISVIIPTFNRSGLLDYTLNSLSHQSLCKSLFEVIVVDDGSWDDTFQMTKTYERLLNIKYLYQVDKGYRPASARNLGISVSEATYCLFIDSGIIVKSDCLQVHLEEYAKHPENTSLIGYTYGWGAEAEELAECINPKDADQSIHTLVNMGRVTDIRENIYRKYQDNLQDLTVPWTLFYGGHFSTPRRYLLEVGQFDENYDGHWGTEDQDLGYRLHLAHVQLVLCRDAMVLHLPHESDNELKEKDGQFNCQYFHEKFKTIETQLFLECYPKDVAVQFARQEVFDFHEYIVNYSLIEQSAP